ATGRYADHGTQVSAGLEVSPPPARRRLPGSAQLSRDTSRGGSPAAGAFAGRLYAGHVDSTPEAAWATASGDLDSPRDSPGCERGFPQYCRANYDCDSPADSATSAGARPTPPDRSGVLSAHCVPSLQSPQ